LFKDLLGKEFSYGGRGPLVYDCYGLALEVGRRVGIDFPPQVSYTSPIETEKAILKGAECWRKIESPELYSLVTFSLVFPYTDHVGITLEYNRFIHITATTRVTIERWDKDPWVNKLRGFYQWQG
jgi:cell wall-associated NlpC family hydrolase